MAVEKKTGFWSVVFYSLALNLAIRWLATGAASGPKSLPIWIAAAALFLGPLVLATLDLSARYPGEGAIYAWTRQTQGGFAGFMCGWLYWFSTLPFFVSLLIFIDSLFGRAISGVPGCAGLGAWMTQPLGTFVVSAAMVTIVALLHTRGLGVGRWIPIAGTTATLLIYGLLIGAGAWLVFHGGAVTDFKKASYVPTFDSNGAILWATMVFAYGGAEGAALLRNEIKGGVKTLTRALLLVGILLAVAYALGTSALLALLPQDLVSRLGGLPDAIQAALQKLGVTGAILWLLLILGFSQLGGLSAWFGVNARLPFAAGLDHVLPAWLAKSDAKTGAPVASIWLQVGIVVALLAFSQAGATVAAAYDFANAMSTLSYTLPYVFLFIAYWKAQSAGPVAEGLTGPKLARLIAAVGLITALTAILCSLVPSPDAKDPVEATIKLGIATAVLLLMGATIYVLGQRKARLSS